MSRVLFFFFSYSAGKLGRQEFEYSSTSLALPYFAHFTPCLPTVLANEGHKNMNTLPLHLLFPISSFCSLFAYSAGQRGSQEYDTFLLDLLFPISLILLLVCPQCWPTRATTFLSLARDSHCIARSARQRASASSPTSWWSVKRVFCLFCSVRQPFSLSLTHSLTHSLTSLTTNFLLHFFFF